MKLMIVLAFLASPVLADGAPARFMADIPACLSGAEDRAMAEACIGTGARACMESVPDGQTTVGMMDCLLAERDAWDRLLNQEYAAARTRAQGADDAERPYFPEYAVRVTQLRDAQRAWIAFRDAECALHYGAWGAGSMRQIAGADCLLQMTGQRTLDLRRYLAED